MQGEEKTVIRHSEFWGICCEGGKKYSQVVRQRFHITMAALDPTVVPTSPVVSLMVDRGGCDYLLCSLKPGSVLQVNLNLYFDKGEKVTFSLRGQGKIHLSGYLIYGTSDPVQSGKSEPLKSMKSQCNLIQDKTSNKFGDDKKKVQKKVQIITPQKVMQKTGKLDNKDSEDSSEENNELVKKGSPKKELPKPKESEEDDDDEDDDDFDEEEDSDEDDDSDEEDDNLKNDKDSNKLQSYKRLWSSLTNEDEESDSSEEDAEMNKVTKELQSKKRLKSDSSSPVSAKKVSKNASSTAKLEVINVDSDEPVSAKKTPKLGNSDLNSSIGRTPMPQKKTPMINQNKASTDVVAKKVTFSESDDSDSDDDVKSAPEQVPPNEKEQLNDSSSLTPSKKKKRKKKKKSAATLNDSNVSDSGKTNTTTPSTTYNKKLASGLEFEDIRVGNGPIAKKGRLAHVYYVGKLGNDKVFDKCEPGSKAFSFKIGSEQVIKGWDIGIEGMKVGGKRRLKIPPHLGYKNQRTGPIPPNSTLYFTVELKAVS